MNPSELKKLLAELPPYERIIVLLFVLSRWLRFKIARLRPATLLIPVTLAQIAVFVLTVLYSRNLLVMFAVGNMLIVGIAVFPLTLIRPRPAAHWIRPND